MTQNLQNKLGTLIVALTGLATVYASTTAVSISPTSSSSESSQIDSSSTALSRASSETSSQTPQSSITQQPQIIIPFMIFANVGEQKIRGFNLTAYVSSLEHPVDNKPFPLPLFILDTRIKINVTVIEQKLKPKITQIEAMSDSKITTISRTSSSLSNSNIDSSQASSSQNSSQISSSESSIEQPKVQQTVFVYQITESSEIKTNSNSTSSLPSSTSSSPSISSSQPTSTTTSIDQGSKNNQAAATLQEATRAQGTSDQHSSGQSAEYKQPETIIEAIDTLMGQKDRLKLPQDIQDSLSQNKQKVQKIMRIQSQLKGEFIHEESEDVISLTTGLIFTLFFFFFSNFVLYVIEQRNLTMKTYFQMINDECTEVTNLRERQQVTNHSLVLINGKLKVETPIKDTDMNIEFPDSLLVRRQVQMFQLNNNQEEDDNQAKWSEKIIFTQEGDVRNTIRNPLEKFVLRSKEYSQNLSVGGYVIHQKYSSRLKEFQNQIEVTDYFKEMQQFNQQVSPILKEQVLAQHKNNVFYVGDDKEYMYLSEFRNEPSLGDLRISYTHVPNLDFTIIGMQQDQYIIPAYLSQQSPSEIKLALQKEANNFVDSEQIQKIGPNEVKMPSAPDNNNFNQPIRTSQELESLYQSQYQGSLYQENQHFLDNFSIWGIFCLPCYIVNLTNKPNKKLFIMLRGKLTKKEALSTLVNNQQQSIRQSRAAISASNLVASYMISSLITNVKLDSQPQFIKTYFIQLQLLYSVLIFFAAGGFSLVMAYRSKMNCFLVVMLSFVIWAGLCLVVYFV